jgi:hypothetical protein
MKIRNGFVSNSSSSSYIIKIADSEPCPTCGRCNPNIVDHIQNRTYYCDDETGMDYDCKESVLKDIEANINDAKARLEGFFRLKPHEIPPEYKRWGCKTTAEEFIIDTHEELRRLHERHKIISAIEGEVYGIRISYHDEHVQHIFDQGVKEGSIEIIEDHN